MAIKTISSNHVDVIVNILQGLGPSTLLGTWTEVSDQISIEFNKTVDYDYSPFVPPTAIILGLTLNIQWSASGPTEEGNNGFLSIYIPPPPTTLYTYDSGNIALPTGIQNIAWKFYDDPTGINQLTIAGVITQFSSMLMSLGASICTSGSILAWSLDVEYDLEAFSWYIKPTIKKVNGKDTIIIEDEETDIIEVPEGEDPPEGYEFYGTSEDYPDGPLFIYWESNEEYLFFIYSPISPGEDWVAFDGVPTCTGCITVALGALEVLLADASGIYTLTPDKTSDSLYVRESFSVFVDTVEVKIPNPTVRFGFVP